MASQFCIEKIAFCGYNINMIKLRINNKEVSAANAVNLKELLPQYGMDFPCGGKGICGRCKIFCPQLEPSALDKRFFTEKQLAEGMRLACDKIAQDGISIDFEQKAIKQQIKLDYCDIVVIIDYQTVEIGILNEHIIDSAVLQNTAADTMGLRSLIGRECIELFERYGVAKADTIAVATNAHFAKMLLGAASEGKGELLDALEYTLPGETLYLLPFVDEDIGAQYLCKALQKSFPRIIIDAGRPFIAGLFTDEDIFCLAHSGVEYSADEAPALQASIELLLQQSPRAVISLYGKQSSFLADILKNYSFVTEEESTLEFVARACGENRVRNQLLKLRSRVSLVDTVTSDEWQQLFLSAHN